MMGRVVVGPGMRAAYALCNPTPVQVRILTTAGAVRHFVERLQPGMGGPAAAPPLYNGNAIGYLQEHCRPLLPQYESDAVGDGGGFAVRCRVGEAVTSAVGASKQRAKMAAAELMCQRLFPM